MQRKGRAVDEATGLPCAVKPSTEQSLSMSMGRKGRIDPGDLSTIRNGALPLLCARRCRTAGRVSTPLILGGLSFTLVESQATA